MIDNQSLNHFEVSVFQNPKINQTVCGDGYFIKETDDYLLCAVIDGLGSGEPAQQASKAAVEAITQYTDLSVDSIMVEINQTLSNYRGAVVSIFKINYSTGQYSYCSVGNVETVLIPPNTKPIRLLPNGGFLSGRPVTIKTQNNRYPQNAILMMYSDGLKACQALQNIDTENCSKDILVKYIYPVIREQSHDDMTLLVAKPNSL